jgi:hypothetical protein
LGPREEASPTASVGLGACTKLAKLNDAVLAISINSTIFTVLG